MFLIVLPQQSILLKWLVYAGSGHTHHYFNELQQESTFPDEKSDALSLFFEGGGRGRKGVTYLLFKSRWHQSSQLR